jgi:hypothetical protein
MDEKEANIDVLFRNGLKDYEVLPPVDVWDRISPEIRKTQMPYFILRAAAMIAVIVTLGFLTFIWNSEVSENAMNSASTEIFTTPTPQALIPEPMLIADAGITQSINSVTLRPAPENTSVLAEDKEGNDISTGSITNPFLTHDLSEYASGINGSILISQNTPVTKSITVGDYSALYTPDIPVTSKKERWSIAALVSPTFHNSFQSSNNEAVRQLGSVEQPIVSYAGGVALSYKVNRRLSVQSGLYYSSYGNELSGISSFGGFQNYDQVKGNSNFEVRTTNGTVYTNNSDVYLVDNLSDSRIVGYIDNNTFDPSKASLEYLDNSLRQNLSYLELPIILRYKLVDKTFDFNIIGGLSSNLLVDNSVYASMNSGKYEVGKTDGLNQVSFSSSLGMGMEYSFSKNLSLNLEPTFRYYLNPFNSVEGIRVHPYSFGIFSGISYKF